MKSNSSVLKLAGQVGLIFTIQQQGVQAIKATAGNQVTESLSSLADSVQQSLLQEGSEAYANSDLQQMIESHVSGMIENQETQKTNLEESSATEQNAHKKHHKKHHHKKHHKHENKPAQHENVVVKAAETVVAKQAAPKSAPASKTLIGTKATDATEWAKWSQNFDVPIDEVKPITIAVSPTYDLDHVESVTLKSFRKVVGYDTFNSILKKDRDEKKDQSDYYNVTVSMMIRRIPEDVAHPPTHDPYNPTGVSLASTLDKGFPYDDGDNTTDDQTPNWKKGSRPQAAQLVGKLNGENITKSALVNLIRDTDAPITQSLIQLDEMKSDSDNVSTLFDSNVTRGNLKNLITDKPAPITVALAQKSDSDNVSTLFDSNVTRGNLKNLITDKPAPITVALAQKSDSDNVSTLFDSNVTRGNLKNLITDKPAPITVALAQKSDSDNVSTLFDSNVTRGNLKNLITDKPAPITVALAQKSDSDNVSTLFDSNVTRGNLKNLITDKPAPITVALAQKSDSDNVSTLFDSNVTRGNLKNLITDKPAPITVALAQKSDSDNVSTLFDSNVTRGNLKNLITDKPAPITVALAQKSDSDNVSTLFDSNVTRGNLKNLITDKPAPITVALAQKSDSDNVSTLFDSNVTRGNLKNLITDKPAPITVALAQKSDSDNVSTLFDSNVTRGNLKNLITDKPAPITVALAQKSDSDNVSTLFDSNVTRGNLKNLITDKPAPITVALAQKGPLVKSLLQLEKSDKQAVLVRAEAAVVQSAKKPVSFATQVEEAPFKGVDENEDMGLTAISVNGMSVDLRQTSDEKAAYEKVVAKEEHDKNTWVNKNNLGSDDAEVINLRKKLQKGVLTYGNYIDSRAGSY